MTEGVIYYGNGLTESITQCINGDGTTHFDFVRELGNERRKMSFVCDLGDDKNQPRMTAYYEAAVGRDLHVVAEIPETRAILLPPDAEEVASFLENQLPRELIVRNIPFAVVEKINAIVEKIYGFGSELLRSQAAYEALLQGAGSKRSPVVAQKAVSDPTRFDCV